MSSIAVMYQPEEQLDQVVDRLAAEGLRITPHWTGKVEAIHKDEIEHLRDGLKAKVAEVKRSEGAKLIGHPGYRFNPRHSNNPDIYIPARQGFIDKILAAAKRDREKNPAFQRAESIRNLHAGA